MAKRKGMSAEEKRRVVLSIYHTTVRFSSMAGGARCSVCL